MFIYEIRNSVNNKVYIGQTIHHWDKRWHDHIYAATKSERKHPLYNSMRKYGIDCFEFRVIDSATSLRELNEKEKLHLDNAKTCGKVYNLRDAGENKTHSVESIEKMRLSQREAHARRKANGRDGGWTRNDGGAMKGKRHPGKGKVQKPRSDTQKETIRIANIASGKLRKGLTWQVVEGKRVWMEKENF